MNSQEKDPLGMTKNDLKALVLHNGLAVLTDVSYPTSVDQSQRFDWKMVQSSCKMSFRR